VFGNSRISIDQKWTSLGSQGILIVNLLRI